MGVGAALDLVAGWLLFASLAGCTGSVAGRWVLVPPDGAGLGVAAGDLRRAAARIGRGSAVALLVALALVLARQLIEFRDPWEPWGPQARLLLWGTGWGRVWLLAAALAVVAAGALHAAARGSAVGWWVATPAALALNAFPGLTGHAGGGDVRWLTLPADLLHVTSAGGWAGGLAVVLWLAGPGRPGSARPTEGLLAALVARFSPLAMASVATLALTGTVASVVHVGSAAGLLGTAYGRALVLKLALVCGVLALGAFNHLRLRPKLGDAAGRSRLMRVATAELALAAVVLALTALLVRMDPSALP